METTIDKDTRTTLGVLWAILSVMVAATGGGAFYLNDLKNDVVRVADGQARNATALREVRSSVDKMREDFAKSDRSVAILTTLLQALEKKVDTNERRLDAVEKAINHK